MFGSLSRVSSQISASTSTVSFDPMGRIIAKSTERYIIRPSANDLLRSSRARSSKVTYGGRGCPPCSDTGIGSYPSVWLMGFSHRPESRRSEKTGGIAPPAQKAQLSGLVFVVAVRRSVPVGTDG